MLHMKKVVDARVRSKCRIAHREEEVVNPYEKGTPEFRSWESETDKIFFERLESNGLRGFSDER